MGWNSAGDIFDPVAKALVELNAPADMKIRVLGDLIGALQAGDWDTEDESLEEFEGDPAIVEAFRQHDVTLTCGVDGPGQGQWCDLESGHDGRHRDEDGEEFDSAAIRDVIADLPAAGWVCAASRERFGELAATLTDRGFSENEAITFLTDAYCAVANEIGS